MGNAGATSGYGILLVVRPWSRGTDGSSSPGERMGPGSAEHRLAALVIAVLLVVGGCTGLVNAALDGVARDGVTGWTYTATMAALVLAAVPLVVRRRVGRWSTFGLVLLGHLVYVVVAQCIDDPVRYATPMVLLFSCSAAAWFLDRWMLGVVMALTPVACLAALAGSYPGALGLAVRVGVDGGMLVLVSVTVYLLRRRVQRLLAATEALSQSDPLTGLANRRHLVDQAPRAWRTARREGLRVAAMVLDLDHFKQVNDAHGHAAGDAVLRGVATALSDCVRPSDLLARLGGEELVVLGLVADNAEAARLAERLRSAVAGSSGAHGHPVTASIGVALTNPVDGEDVTEALWRLVDRADAAMYEAKQAGRDRVATSRVPRPRSAPTGEVVDPPTRPGAARTDVG
ncbi:diguanylate cyclase (GGDEF) domain-containing protein [Geodermatophilus telluris]|uniref:Diguanylate cyclase (GGDEF) domain-containing protein n=1 Tax=Geodermatophilus telluris TaxID=1190417 RepID=A0A1G6SGU0_9ACTN|nr:GGDEF domain-containing protein [Geodermatophilus telluris]SDD15851.1 diguanylate cyclase (GGDEF) domain-containing protein [Geodermatophilus telluris]